MKLVSYDPKEVDNIPRFFNKNLEEFKDEKYIMFIFNDIADVIKDKTVFCNSYKELLEKLDLPYAFFPYYIHFNRILPDLIRKPSPRISVSMGEEFKFDIVQEPSYGMLVLDVEKLAGYRFNEEYTRSFYLQDLIQYCVKNNLYFSGSFFIDVHGSYDMVDSDFKDGLIYNVKDFADEKKRYFEKNKNNITGIEQINDFVTKLKKKYGTKVEEVKTTVVNEEKK